MYSLRFLADISPSCLPPTWDENSPRTTRALAAAVARASCRIAAASSSLPHNLLAPCCPPRLTCRPVALLRERRPRPLGWRSARRRDTLPLQFHLNPPRS